MDPRLAEAPPVTVLAGRLAEVTAVVGLYVGGSLASGDYRPGTSDLDVVAVLGRRPGVEERRRLVALHRGLRRSGADDGQLHCCYVSLDRVDDVALTHWTWAFDELFERPLSGIARAELLADPVVVSGPAASTLLPGMDEQAVRAAARDELTGYWAGALRRRCIWLQDTYVDLALVTLARVHVTLTESRLVTKREAIERLPEVGVPPELADEVACRRAGGTVTLSWAARRRRARLVRTLMAAGISGPAETPPEDPR